MKKVSNFGMVTVTEVGYQHSFLWKHNEQFHSKVFPDLALSAKFSLNHWKYIHFFTELLPYVSNTDFFNKNNLRFYYVTELLLDVNNTDFFNKNNMCFYYATELLLYVNSTDFFNRNNMCFYHATELLLYVNNTDFFNKNNLRFYYTVIFQIIFWHELNRFGLKECHFFLYKFGGLTVR